jgi:hypothetical protein
MTLILMWDKPTPVMTKEQRDSISADGAPPGCYVPNMSPTDRMRWKAKLVGTTKGFPQVEIRRDSTVVILSLKGYKYNNYDTRQTPENEAKWLEYTTARYSHRATVEESRKCVHIATAGAMQMTLAEFGEFQQAVTEGFQVLNDLEMGIVR